MQDTNKKPVEDMSNVQVIASPRIKLKDKAGRGGVVFNLQKDFGFIPEKIIVQKVQGQSNTIVVSAVLTQEMLEKELLKKKKANDEAGGKPVISEEKVKEAVERVSGSANNDQPVNEVDQPKNEQVS